MSVAFLGKPEIGYGFAITLVGLLSTFALYARLIFPMLPAQYGGGRRSSAVLLLSSKLDPSFTAGQLPQSQDGLRLGPVDLLLETNDTLVVAVERSGIFRPDKPAFALDRKLLQACQFLPSSPNSSVTKASSPAQPTHAP
jgi:hypothetical protein